MDDRLRAVLDGLHRAGVEHDAVTPDRSNRYRNLEPDSAALLALLVRACGAQSLLELGTSNGYSTLWLADAARDTGGCLVTVDSDGERSGQARDTLTRVGLAQLVDLRIADAAQVLAESSDGQWDFILLDAERPAYAGYWADLVRALRVGGLLAVDNVLSHAEQVGAFRAVVASDPRVEEAVVPTGAGVLLVVRRS
ncbi:O-methyltransferase [Tsukamurella soli]|uniref:O-methyltransferase n=1 Tax=Tsukamurella soli TaxID=644556 RepID=A0ABP8KH26_9ACTN